MKIFKTSIAAATAVAVIAGGSFSAMAVERKAAIGGQTAVKGTAEKAGALSKLREQLIEKARNRGFQMIDQRLRALEREVSRIRAMSQLTEEQKNEIVGELESAMDSLRSLRERIANETDPQALKAEIKSIVTNHRVYKVAIPKGLALVAVERASWGAQRFDKLAERLQERIDKAKAAGKDVTDVQALLDQFKAKIADAKAHIEQAREAFQSMVTVDPEAARSAMQEGKSHLREARAGFREAIGLVRQIVQEFKEIRGSDESSPTP